MKIETDDRSGFCFGVVRAIRMAEESVAQDGRLWALGDIVHNRMEVERLARKGLVTLCHGDIACAAGERILIRAHGEPPSTYEIAKKNAISVIDATCPVVARLQQEVKQACLEMRDVCGQVIILGEKGHAEVVGLAGQDTLGNVRIVEGLDDLEGIDRDRPVYLLSQTTQSLSLFEKVARRIKDIAADADRVTIHDTICRQVSGREDHLREFAGKHDVIIFVSGRKSSNGKSLYSLCRSVNSRSYMVEEAADLSAGWFAGARSAGVCGATSTPRWLMDEVARTIEEITGD